MGLLDPIQSVTFFQAKFESLCFHALLFHQKPSQSDLLVSFMYLVALTIDIFLSKFVSSYFHKHCSCSLAILCLSRALRTLVWPRYSDLSYQVRVFWFSQAMVSRSVVPHCLNCLCCAYTWFRRPHHLYRFKDQAHRSSLPHIGRRFSSLIYRSSFLHSRRRFSSFDLRLSISIESRRSPGTFPVAAGSIREDLRNDTHHGDTLQFSHH